MAQAQKLAEKVKSMGTRIHELELALSQAQTEGSDHPLLRHRSADEELDDDNNKAAWDSELAVLSDSVGSLSIGSYGPTIYHGETASSEANIHLCFLETVLVLIAHLVSQRSSSSMPQRSMRSCHSP